MRRPRGRVKEISTQPQRAEMEEETAVLIHARATTSTRTGVCQKTPSPITHPVVCIRKLLPVTNQEGGLAKNGGTEGQNNQNGNVSLLLHEQVG